jgi:hypothetical protein
LLAADTGVLAGMAAVQVYFFAKLGIYPLIDDADGYVRYADEIASALALPVSPASPAPASLWTSPDFLGTVGTLSMFRMPGYSFLIMLTKLLAGSIWVETIVGLQIVLAILAGYAVYRTVSTVSGYRVLGFICAFIFIVSYRTELDRRVITDSIYTSIATLLICWAVCLIYLRQAPTRLGIATAGLGFCALFLLREMTLTLALAALPLMVLLVSGTGSPMRWARRLVVLYTPLVAAVTVVLIWNYGRTGYAFITTGAETSAVYSLGQLEKRGTPVFTSDSPLDRTARDRLRTYAFPEAMYVSVDLFRNYGLTAPEIAGLATRKYFAAWRQHPGPMFDMLWSNLRQWRYVMFNAFARDVMAASASCVLCNGYERHVVNLFLLCMIILPSTWLLVSLVWPWARRHFLIVVCLSIYVVVPSAAYAAVSFDLRYVLFTIAPLLLILALSVGAAARACKDLARRLIFQGGNIGAEVSA